MPLTDPALWARIEAYPLPDDSAGRSFKDQLRAEHGISGLTAERAIMDYRRFLYLCALDQGRCVPTQAVDAVWHLHLSHTRDYWQGLVPLALKGRAIHHEPGAPDGHRADFAATRARYEAEFGAPPPKGMWKRRSLIGEIVPLVFVALFVSAWMSIVLLGDAPRELIVVSFAIGVMALAAVSRPILDRAGFEVGYEFDIWADSEGGDCGDCGGGCGD
ncbi:glycine-rich domain-containing protein [Jannaschia ovalis]|uniref:TIGR04222 domain-containing protein n=1 Tax=Jannaschia ovalis TaxID=3038773 RepID=A0ABY8LGD7_9RHOB|nr:hypothetical protein [Jannaschia sp. GRR-S6-38]WGH79712.1 hypothetical protein P8627_05470 [Jannaschia sp. GRR-S6-38]